MRKRSSIHRITTIWILVLASATAFSQGGENLHFARTVPQSIYKNPAFKPHHDLNISLPGMGSTQFSLANSGFRYNDAIRPRERDDSLELTMDRVLNALYRRNYLTLNAHMDLFHGGIKKGKNYFSVNVTDRIHTRLIYPSSLIKLLWEGNGGEFLGERVDLSKLRLDHMYYREFGFGMARDLDESTTLGARAKFLQGLQNIRTEVNTLGLRTHEETFGWTVNGKAEINTSGMEQLWDEEQQPGAKDIFFVGGNYGFSADIGVESQLSETVDLSVAVLDLGAIRWGNNIKRFKSNDVNFTYEGGDLVNLYEDQDTTVENAIETLEDSIEDAFNITRSGDPYTTPLSGKIQAGATVELAPRTEIGALGRVSFVRGQRRGALTINLRHHNHKGLRLMASYSVQNRSADNVGAGFSARIGPVQWHFLSDNILAPFRPHKIKTLQFQTGINLTFGGTEDDPFEKKTRTPDEEGPAKKAEGSGETDESGEKKEKE